jgi:hypothetical protein
MIVSIVAFAVTVAVAFTVTVTAIVAVAVSARGALGGGTVPAHAHVSAVISLPCGNIVGVIVRPRGRILVVGKCGPPLFTGSAAFGNIPKIRGHIVT